jgi:ribosomal protein L3 glutamine methyltransferase
MSAIRPAAALTLGELIAHAHARLKSGRLAYGQGIANAWDEAVYLARYVLRLNPEDLARSLSRRVHAREYRRTERLLDERIRRRVPAAYLTREAWLGELRFYVDERVIVPRSFIAELLRERLSPWLRNPWRVRRILDLCTGSGCLAIVAAKMFGAARVDASDISRDALAVARRNVAAYRMRQRVRLHESDLFSAFGNRRYDLIIANPPYVRASAMRRLPREFRHEPHIALAGGADGFDAVRTILQQAPAHLNERGLLVVEVGHRREQIEAAFPRVPFIWPLAGGAEDCVFILECGDLAASAQAVQPAAAAGSHRASRAAAASRRR